MRAPTQLRLTNYFILESVYLCSDYDSVFTRDSTPPATQLRKVVVLSDKAVGLQSEGATILLLKQDNVELHPDQPPAWSFAPVARTLLGGDHRY